MKTANRIVDMIRKLSIVFSFGCGGACLLLVTLWMRSYWYEDRLSGPAFGSGSLHFHSEAGWLTLTTRARPGRQKAWRWMSQNIEERNLQELQMLAAGATLVRTEPRLGVTTRPFSRSLQAPHWLLAMLPSTLAALPWMARRFSLRTAFIATTLLAAVLWAVVWAAA